MHLTPEEIEQQGEAFVAFLKKQLIQVKTQRGEWQDYIPYINPDWYNWLFRPKPEPVTRPWGRKSDVPMPNCWLHSNKSTLQFAVNGVSDFGIYIARDVLSWVDLRGWSYSTDGNPEHAKPCTTEAAKLETLF